MYERDDFPLAFQTLQPTPFRQATEAVVAPAGSGPRRVGDHRRPDPPAVAADTGVGGAGGDAKGIGAVRCSAVAAAAGRCRDPARRGRRPVRVASRRADASPRLAAEHPHGTVLAPNLRAGVLADTVVYRGAPDAAAARRDRRRGRGAARAAARPTAIRMRLIGMRETRSENSWMHNSPLLMRGDRHQRALHARRRRGRGYTSSTATWCG